MACTAIKYFLQIRSKYFILSNIVNASSSTIITIRSSVFADALGVFPKTEKR